MKYLVEIAIIVAAVSGFLIAKFNFNRKLIPTT